MKSLHKEINFDGINFWYRDLKLGQIADRFIFNLNCPIPKEVMMAEKNKMLGKVIGC